MRVPVASALLQVAALGVDVCRFEFIQPPTLSALRGAVKLLLSSGAAVGAAACGAAAPLGLPLSTVDETGGDAMMKKVEAEEEEDDGGVDEEDEFDLGTEEEKRQRNARRVVQEALAATGAAGRSAVGVGGRGRGSKGPRKLQLRLTPLGRVLARLPLPIAVGKMLMVAVSFDVLNSAVVCASAFSLHSVSLDARGSGSGGGRAELGRLRSPYSDVLTSLAVYRTWIWERTDGP
eukprot:GHVU01232170.1.p1 GENE.GHVU01232170.1~~GHVU01232170.1.p1  ORF type:complete len:234 (+),score=54.68 GHVU01232170.1:423-1124(+)